MKFKHHLNALVFGILVAVKHDSLGAEISSPRVKISLDQGWKYHLGNSWGDVLNLAKAGENKGPANPDFSDVYWRTVNLPHDWAIELPFDQTADCNHGFKPVGAGFPQNNLSWYRRTIDLPATDEGKRLWLDFDGVFHSCDVYVNGWFVGHHDDGYDSFQYDITDVVHPGKTNSLAVLVDASQSDGWFYEGAGIYRHVWLEKTGPLAIAPDGVFVYDEFPKNRPGSTATIKVDVSLLNLLTNSAQATVKCRVISPEGTVAATFSGKDSVKTLIPQTLHLEGKVSAPKLWSPESPNLYRLVTTVVSGGRVLDSKETEFGIRTLAFDPNEGFLLNGRHYEIYGMCNHQDAAGVGSALPDALQYFRIKKLKEMGCNACRTSHNAPTPELLEACDRLGMLVLDENRLFGSDAANLERFKGQIMRDRNHPSVFAWSLANEEWSAQDSADGAAMALTMQNLAHSLDPTRQCTAAVNSDIHRDQGFFKVLDVKGFNYHFESMDAYHAAFPLAPILGTEQSSEIGTRGIYTNDASRGYVSAYDDHNPRWGQSAEEWWSFFAQRPWASGGFSWTGFDYRGEPTPYEWPCISSHFGSLDTCGFPKDNFWYYQAWWTQQPVLHVLPHWNWPGREGQEIDVRALSNCQEVELFLNGQSLGRQTMKRESELKWKVNYAPGVLSAKGYQGGRVVAETKVETTGQPATLRLTPDRSIINADGTDLSIFTVAALDAEGRVNPLATNMVHFELAGSGKILGVGNGDPTCHEPDTFITPAPDVRHIRENDGWHFKILANVLRPDMAELQPEFDDSAWDQTDPAPKSGTLHENQQAVFRKKFTLGEADMSEQTMLLRIGSIDDEGWVYVNGKRVGESHDWNNSPTFDIKPLVHAGENSLAIAVVNHGGSGGLCQGVSLELVHASAPPHWQRSVFNGLAQILVQSTQEPGDIKLTASADDLTSATVTVQSKEATEFQGAMNGETGL